MISKLSKFSICRFGDGLESSGRGFCDLAEGDRCIPWELEGVSGLADGGRGMVWLVAGVPDLEDGGRGIIGSVACDNPGELTGDGAEACDLLRLSDATVGFNFALTSSVFGW